MKILFTESSSNIGGQELQALAQIQSLLRNGHEVVVACRKGSGIADRAIIENMSVVFIPFRNSIHLPSLLSMRRLMTHFRPDVVVCHSGHDSNTVGIARLLIFRRSARPVVLRQKAYLTERVGTFPLNYLCDAVMVPGCAAKETLVSAGCRNTITVIPPGFDFARIHREAEQFLPAHITRWLKHSGDAPVIVQVGMLRPEKGHDFFLDVLFHLRQKGIAFRWLIVGTGKHREVQVLHDRIAQYQMQDRVLMTGAVFPVAPVWRVANLVVLPSRKESFGMVLAEASSCSVPVMASRIGGIPDVICDEYNGLLLPPDDRAAWMAALTRFHRDPEAFRTMATRAKDEIEVAFSIEGTTERILALAQKYVRR
ncbi:glycosyltransferase [Salmonella enterica]|nr:glycosyltransferase [Salmonella enterica subsp. enterica]EKY7109951.1 glycosyltransferase [Salmonella enterica]